MAKKRKVKSFINGFNDRETKGDIRNTLIKSTVDIISSGTLGAGIGAISGKHAPLAGVALIIAGHYLGDKSGVLRLTGASILTYGIAKAKDYQNNPKYDSSEKRLSGLKDDLLTTLHINWNKDQAAKASQSQENISASKDGQLETEN